MAVSMAQANRGTCLMIRYSSGLSLRSLGLSPLGFLTRSTGLALLGSEIPQSFRQTLRNSTRTCNKPVNSSGPSTWVKPSRNGSTEFRLSIDGAALSPVKATGPAPFWVPPTPLLGRVSDHQKHPGSRLWLSPSGGCSGASGRSIRISADSGLLFFQLANL